jgi:hypothetical protein
VSEWWLGIPDAEARLSCAGETHRLRWHAGALLAVNHEDAEGERTLAALAGERCACVDVLDAWARHAHDLRVFTLASRGAADQLAASFDRLGSGGAGGQGLTVTASGGSVAYVSGGAGPAGWDEVEDDLVPLLGLGAGLTDRLMATVAAAWSDPAERGAEEAAAAHAQLKAALYGRAVLAIRAWLAEPELEVDLRMVEAAAESRVTRLDVGGVRAELPFSWLSDVWSRGLTTVCRRFCLSAHTDDGRRWTLSTVRPDLDNTELITLELDGRS